MRFYCSAKISDNIEKTPEGFLVCRDVPIARTGEMLYLPGEVEGFDESNAAIIRVERSEDEVFNDEAIRSFEGKSITIGHPSKFVGPENYKQVEVGTLHNVRRGMGAFSNKLLTDMLIKDGIAIKKIENRELREVSCGYDTKFIPLGTDRAKQTNIRGNHAALVPRGRAGPECAIFDSAPKGLTMSPKEKLLSLFSKAIDKMPEGDDDDTASDDFKLFKKKAAKEKEDLETEKAASDKKAKDAQAAADKALADLKVAQDALTAKDADLKKVTDELATLKKTDPGTKATHDAAVVSAAEILAPGIAKDTADLKVAALTKAYATDEGKIAIHVFTGGKAPVYDNAAVVDVIFNGAAVLVADERKRKLGGGGNGGQGGKQNTNDQQTGDFMVDFGAAADKLFPVPKL